MYEQGNTRTDAIAAARRKAKTNKRLKMAGIFASAAIALPLNAISMVETFRAVDQNYPLMGLIESGDAGSVGMKIATVSAGISRSVVIGSEQHFLSVSYSPGYCTDLEIIRPIARTILGPNNAAPVASSAYRVAQMFIGMPGALVGAFAHGVYIGTLEAASNGQHTNLSACGQRASERYAAFDGYRLN